MRGKLVAAALVGAWRRDSPPPTLSAGELDQVAPLLMGAGCGALAWWRIRRSPDAGSPVGEKLREAYRLHALQAAVHEREIGEVVRVLGTAGVEALLVKGWTAARLYAEPGLRPYGDIDVCVPPDQHDNAQAALAEAGLTTSVDLHGGLAINSGFARDLPSFENAVARASRLPLEGSDVLVLAPEDHLALLSVHLLTHGAWRPLWLCDVAAAIESLPDNFDWDRCLGRSGRLTTWVTATVALAQQLLGAQPRDLPPTGVARPRWLERAVLKQWGLRRPEYPADLIDLPKAAYIRPSTAARVVRAHWVDPIMATIQTGASFSELPRLPFRVGFVAWKAGRFVRSLSGRAGPRAV